MYRARVERNVKATAQEKGAGASVPGRWSAVKQFFRESRLELQKVIWPTREEAMKLTGLVIVVVVVVGIFMFGWDQFIGAISSRLFAGR